ncbi:MAG TPA: hypothetical protein VMU95_41985 [Trebonia sp.]|nr:hypothetical protein [Trebonia sp.]
MDAAEEPAVDAAEEIAGAARPARVWVSVAGLLTDDDQRLVLSALAARGATAATIETLDSRRNDAATLTWVVLAALPLQAFLSGLGETLADDAHERLAAAVKRVADRYEARRGRRGGQGDAAAGDSGLAAVPRSPAPLVLIDSDSRLEIVIEADLPAEAIGSLVALDLSPFTIGPLHYDRAAGRWRSELDEAARRYQALHVQAQVPADCLAVVGVHDADDR